jgi:polyhydroxyalkanoate depolymerase
MLYSLYEAQHMALAPWRYWAELSRGWFGHPFSPLIYMPLAKRLAASSELFLRVTERYEKPRWDIAEAVPEVADARPFCNLVHFKQSEPKKTKVLVVAPLSGHHATLLRDTVRALLPEHEVWITDGNARSCRSPPGRSARRLRDTVRDWIAMTCMISVASRRCRSLPLLAFTKQPTADDGRWGGRSTPGAALLR